MAAYHRVYDSRTCRLTAKNCDQLRNPTVGNRVWVTFFTVKKIHVSSRCSSATVFNILIVAFLVFYCDIL